MKREFTCIVCPNGCEIEAEYEIKNGTPVIGRIQGNTCKRGEEYVRQELISPKRTIASSILVEGGELPLVSVRITKPIPREKIPEAMKEIRQYCIKAPVKAGTVISHDFLGYDTDLITTKNVPAAQLTVSP